MLHSSVVASFLFYDVLYCYLITWSPSSAAYLIAVITPYSYQITELFESLSVSVHRTKHSHFLSCLSFLPSFSSLPKDREFGFWIVHYTVLIDLIN
jgi:hypothetical protein